MAVMGLAMLTGRPSASALAPAARSAIKVTALTTEYKANPLGIDTPHPRLSWKLETTGRGVVQSGYQIRVARNERDLRSGSRLVWDSTRVASDQSILRPYEGPALASGQKYFWQVRIVDGAEALSDWSDPASWEMGLLQPADWHAKWIEPATPDDTKAPSPSPYLRRSFMVSGDVARARLYVTSHGLYEAHLNGRRVGDELFTPGWTSYNKRLQYQTYDVTSQLTRGANTIGVILGSGWYRGELAWSGHRNLYGEHVGLLLQLAITYANGRTDFVTSDEQWKSSAAGPIVASEIYLGENYDARRELTGWTAAGYSDAQWSGVRVVQPSAAVLVAPEGPPVQRIEEIKAVKLITTPAGESVVDFGQNMVGWIRLKVEGPAGTTVTLRHAEVLDKQGNFYTENLRHAAATVRYTLKGGGVETYEPHFTFQGFRYVAVGGFPGTLALDSLTGIVIHSEITPASEFETSKPLINQLQHNIRWGQKGNFLDVPTDCPQRDERLGWTGDAQVFSRTAAFNMDVAGFFTKWLKDVAADQYPNGKVPHVIPDVLGTPDKEAGGSAAWGDVAVIVPWTMYLSYGDTRVLEEQYPSMKRWVEFERKRAGDDYIWDGDEHFGDWLAFATTRSDYPGATTGKDLIATAMFAHSTDLLAQTATVLGKTEDASQYSALLEKIRKAFVQEYVSSTGRVGENTQTAYVLALGFDLLPDALRPVAAKRLAQEVRERGHLTTGFVGTPYLCHVLSRFGYLDEAYALLNREDYPSWLYPVKTGATTIWERWDGQKPDGSFQDKGMNSFNHYAYGAIGDWMYRVMAGIELDPAAPGYKHVLVQPRPGGGFTSVKASHASPYGTVASAWTWTNGTFELIVTVPPNTHATVRLPGATAASVTEGGKALGTGDGITASSQDGSAVIVETGSGVYRFAYPMAAPPAKAAGATQ